MPDAGQDSPARPASAGARWALAGVLALAFALRLVYVLQSRSSPLFDAPQMDAAYHAEWARAFAAGERFRPGEPFYRAPLYSWFVGVVFKLFGGGLLAPRIVQALLGTCTTGLTYLVGARAFDRRTGLLAALGAATTWTLVYFDGELLIPTLAIPLQLLALYLSLRLDEDQRPLALAGAGAAWGLAAIARPTVLLLVPLVAAWAAWRARGATGAKVRALALVLVGFAVPVLPLTLHNALVAGDFVLISSTGGVNLWIGNNPVSDGSSAVLPGARGDLWGGIEDARRLAEAEEGRALKASGVSRHWSRKAREHVLAHPGDAFEHFLWKLRLCWSSWELGNNTQLDFFARRFGPVLRFLPLSFGVLAPLGLVGLFLVTRRMRELFPLWVFVPVQTAAVVLFFVNARFRLPLVPVLCVLAAHALVRALEAARARRWTALALGAVATGALTWIVHRVPATIDRSDAPGLSQLGQLALQRGDAQEAAMFYGEAVEANPRYPYAQRGLGGACLALGDRDAAQRHLEQARGLLPNDVETLLGLAQLYATEPSRGDLCAVAAPLVELAPGFASAWFYLGRCRLDGARDRLARGVSLDAVRPALSEARDAFARSLALQHDFASAHHLGLAHLLLEEHAEAERAFAEAERYLGAPDAGGFFWGNHAGRVNALRGNGRRDEAVRQAEDLWRRFQNDPLQREAARALLLDARKP